MDKKKAWENFKGTGKIYAYLEMKQIEHLENELDENILKKIASMEIDESDLNGEYKNKWDSIN